MPNNMIPKSCLAIIILVFFIIGCSGLAYGAEALANTPEKNSGILTIQEGIARVHKDNRLIKIKFFDNEMAYQDALLARSVLLPSFNLTALKTYNMYRPATKSGSQNVPTGERNPFSFGADVYQTLFDFGKNLSNYRASKDLLKATQAHTESVRRVVTLEFIIAYFNLLETEKMITVAEKEAESLASYLDDMEHLYKQGVVVKNDLLPAKVKLADARQKLIAARNEKEVVAARLNNILALPLSERIALRDIRMEFPELPEMAEAWKTAQAQRPEVVFYAEQIAASAATERAKAVENFPIFYGEGSYAYTRNQYQAHQDNLAAGLGVKMDLYDGGAARAELLKERARQNQLKEEKSKLIDDIEFEVEDSYFSLKNACEKVSVSRGALEQAAENVRAYRVKYNAGSATSTDVLEAITLQTRAETNYYSADYELKRNYAKLMYSVGSNLAMIYDGIEKEKQ